MYSASGMTCRSNLYAFGLSVAQVVSGLSHLKPGFYPRGVYVELVLGKDKRTIFGWEDIITNTNTIVFVFIYHAFLRYRVWCAFISPTPIFRKTLTLYIAVSPCEDFFMNAVSRDMRGFPAVPSPEMYE